MKKRIKAISILTVAVGIMAAVLLAQKEQASSKQPPPTVRPAGIPATVVRVTDGDTIVCRIGRRVEKVRLIGIDTPETHANEKFGRDKARDRRHRPKEILALGRKAKEFTRKMVPPGSTVWLELDTQERDRYGRLLAYVWFTPKGAQKKAMLNAMLVSGGWAKIMTVPPNVTHAKMFHGLQQKARAERKGIWAK